MSPDRLAPAAPAEPAPQDVVLRFLESTGRPSEARLYIDLFHARPREQFAAIAIDANVMAYAADAVVQDLKAVLSLPTEIVATAQGTDFVVVARSAGLEVTALGPAGPLQPVRLRSVGDGLSPPDDGDGPAGGGLRRGRRRSLADRREPGSPVQDDEPARGEPVRVGAARRRIGPRRICAAVLDSPTCTGGSDRIYRDPDCRLRRPTGVVPMMRSLVVLMRARARRPHPSSAQKTTGRRTEIRFRAYRFRHLLRSRRCRRLWLPNRAVSPSGWDCPRGGP